jgi:carbon-monoxide dehydrogenase large subunit
VTTIKFINNRLICNYMEPRACLAEWDGDSGKFTLTLGSQGVHGIRNTLARDVFKTDLENFRVITRDVGGGLAPSRSTTANTRCRWKARAASAVRSNG